MIVPVKANKPAATQTLKFKASKGVQKPEAFAGGAKEVLEQSTDGGAYEQAGLTAGSDPRRAKKRSSSTRCF